MAGILSNLGALAQGLPGYLQQRAVNQQTTMNNAAFGMKIQEMQQAQAAEQQKRAALAQLAQHPSMAGLPPELVQLFPQMAAERAFPKPVERRPIVVGKSLIDPETHKPLYTEPEKDDDFTKTLKAAGIDPASPEGQRVAKAKLDKMTSHPAPPSVKVDVKTGDSLGKEIGPMVSESRTAALGALQAVDTVGRVRSAIESGNVTLGPTATIRNKGAQVLQVLGAAGKDDEEKLKNTRNVMRGLAQFALAARKQLKGQGQVSDYEGKLIQRAEAGEIDDFTLPELKDFVNVTEKLAKDQHKLHKKNVDVMRGRDDLKNLVPFFEVPDLPDAPSTTPKVRKFNPKTGKIED